MKRIVFRKTNTEEIPTRYISAEVLDGVIQSVYITHGTMTLAFTRENGALDIFLEEIQKVLESTKQ